MSVQLEVEVDQTSIHVQFADMFKAMLLIMYVFTVRADPFSVYKHWSLMKTVENSTQFLFSFNENQTLEISWNGADKVCRSYRTELISTPTIDQHRHLISQIMTDAGVHETWVYSSDYCISYSPGTTIFNVHRCYQAKPYICVLN